MKTQMRLNDINKVVTGSKDADIFAFVVDLQLNFYY